MSRGFCLAAVLSSAVFLLPCLRADAGVFTTLYSFNGGTTRIPDGEYPIAGVILDDTGNILSATFGTVGRGEPGKKCPKCDNNGSIDVIQPSGKLAHNPYVFRPGKGGAFPAGELVLDGSAIYGTTEYGPHTDCGGLGCGTVFKLDSTESVQPVLIASFCRVANCPDGAFPRTGLTSDGKGNLFGTTLLGGTGSGYLCGSSWGGCGTVYQITGDTKLDPPLYSFCTKPQHNLCSDGAVPAGRLLYFKKKLYGTTQFGGKYGQGTVFELSEVRGVWRERVLYSFCLVMQDGICSDGAIPEAGLVADSAGNLYGTTTYGGYAAGDAPACDGNPGCGVVFALAPDGTETVLHKFQGYANNDGALPMGQLAIDNANNLLYGTTLRGQGTASDCILETVLVGCGTIFTLTTAGGGYDVLHTFARTTDGAHPQGALLLNNNALYGTARIRGGQGVKGACDCGTVYSYTVPLPAKSVARLGAHGDNRAGENTSTEVAQEARSQPVDQLEKPAQNMLPRRDHTPGG